MKFFNALRDYFLGVVAELRRVVWPTPTQLVNYFVSVVAGLAVATTVIYGIDLLFIRGLSLIIK